MKNWYAMRRANGDWFAHDDEGRLRVPVFCSVAEAMQARGRHGGMALFKPSVLDERALADLRPANDADHVYFWLVDNPSTHLKRGRALDHAQLALLVSDTRAELPH